MKGGKMKKVTFFLLFFVFSFVFFNQNSFGNIICSGGVAYDCFPGYGCSRAPGYDYMCSSQQPQSTFNKDDLKNDRNVNTEIFQDDLSKQDIDKTKEDLEEVFGDFDAETKEKIREELISKYGDPNKYEMTPDNYAKYLLLQQPTISDSDDMQRFENRLNYYTAKWMVKNFGDPNKYEMLPEHYLRYVLITSPHTLEPSDEEKLADKIIDYTRKWEERLYRINNIISQ